MSNYISLYIVDSLLLDLSTDIHEVLICHVDVCLFNFAAVVVK